MTQATVIHATDINTATSALFGRPMASTQKYITDRVQQFQQRASEFSTDFLDTVNTHYQGAMSTLKNMQIEGIRGRLNQAWQLDTIRPLTTLDEIRSAPPSMQRWVMAHPVLRECHQEYGIVGYGPDYEDPHPTGIGKTHYDYRRVMDGVITLEDNIVVHRQFIEPLVSVEDYLTSVQKSAILNTWRFLDQHCEDSDVDPTGSGTELLP